MKKRNVLGIIFMFVMAATFLTGCVGEEISKDSVKWSYEKRIESVELISVAESGCVYANFDVIILDKEQEIIYKENFEEVHISEDEVYSVDLEDVLPDYISYDKVDAMAVEILNVYDDDVE